MGYYNLKNETCVAQPGYYDENYAPCGAQATVEEQGAPMCARCAKREADDLGRMMDMSWGDAPIHGYDY